MTGALELQAWIKSIPQAIAHRRAAVQAFAQGALDYLLKPVEQARLAHVEQAQQEMSRELAQAAEIQNSSLPKQLPEVEGLDIAGHNLPCRGVGGSTIHNTNLCKRTPPEILAERGRGGAQHFAHGIGHGHGGFACADQENPTEFAQIVGVIGHQNLIAYAHNEFVHGFRRIDGSQRGLLKLMRCRAQI